MARFVLIVLDSVGIGELPDAASYNDTGSNTLANIAEAIGGLHLPTMERMGLGNIHLIRGIAAQTQPLAAWGKMAERSVGKDTTTGHWELAGVVLTHPFPTYPHGFPSEIIESFSAAIGRPVLGNIPASGTEIIKRLGEEHLRTGAPIVYTSADSVFQIAAHEQIVPLDQLYDWCRIARQILVGHHGVGRVIARPFLGTPGSFYRTENRKDFSLEPIEPTILDHLTAHSIPVTAVGKIWDIFAGRGISQHLPAHNNRETLDQVIKALKEKTTGLIFANCVDFDMLWGHRNDVNGYAQALVEFDQYLPTIMSCLEPDDLLCLTADHGCDPTTVSTDHSREYVPLLCYSEKLQPRCLGIRETFADVAQTIAEFFGLEPLQQGESFLQLMR